MQDSPCCSEIVPLEISGLGNEFGGVNQILRPHEAELVQDEAMRAGVEWGGIDPHTSGLG